MAVQLFKATELEFLKKSTGARHTAARSRQDSWASSSKKIRPLEKKLGRKPSTPQIIWKSAVKKFCYKLLCQFLPIIVKIRLQLWNLELGRFLGRWLPRPRENLLGRFWVQGPWYRPSGTSGYAPSRNKVIVSAARLHTAWRNWGLKSLKIQATLAGGIDLWAPETLKITGSEYKQ